MIYNHFANLISFEKRANKKINGDLQTPQSINKGASNNSNVFQNPTRGYSLVNNDAGILYSFDLFIF